MSETPNVLTPRQVAIAFISHEIADVRSRIEQHRKAARDPGSLFHSQIIVFLEQVAHELRRGADFLEFHDASEDE